MDTMEKAPNLQMFKKKKIEVLMLSDHLDEPCVQKLADYEGKKFVSIQKSDLKLEETDEEIKRHNKMVEYYKPLTGWWKDQLTEFTDSGAMKDTGVKIENVMISKRLTDSPVIVVTSQFGYSAQQERVMRAQAFQNKDQLSMMAGRKTLEINGNHPVVHDLLQKVKDDAKDPNAVETAITLFQTAMVESGYDLRDPSDLVNKVYSLMAKTLGVDPNEEVKEIELPDAEEEEVEDDDVEEEDVADAEEEEPVEEAEEDADKKKDEL